MVSAWRLAHWSEIVSQPPEKILSTAIAEPGDICFKKWHLWYWQLTRYTQDVVGHTKKVRELSLSAKPPVNWITCVEIFSREFEVFFKFIDGGLLFPAILSREGLLRWACCHGCRLDRRGWQWWWYKNDVCIVFVEEVEKHQFWLLEVIGKHEIIGVICLHTIVWDPQIQY